ncbi:MAG: galactose mutarotase [Planctomycetota bacterium]
MKFRSTPALALLAGACTLSSPPMFLPAVPFGFTKRGEPVTLYVLKKGSLEVRVSDYGATIVSILVPDRAGRRADVLLGFDSVEGYESDANQYFGCTVGRVANRIANGRFVLDGYEYRLAVNNGPNHLHGGASRSFDKVLWKVVEKEPSATSLTLAHSSPDGEEGYPGRLDVRVRFSLPDEHELRIDYEAASDRPTPINLTNHAYWNLAGEGSPSVLDHEIAIEADHYTPVDDTLIPTGEIRDVGMSPLDLRWPTRIGARIDELIPTPTLGYDHNFVLREGRGIRLAATLRDPSSGRTLELLTTEPGLQFYSGNFLHGQKGKGGKSYAQRSACCLETQHFPDSVNHPSFPPTILRPGQQFVSSTIYRFSIR